MAKLDKVERVSDFINKYFVVWVIAASSFALSQPDVFTWIGEYISPLLGVVMLGMGLTLTPPDLKRIIERPRDVLIGSLAQWTIMPITAYLLVQAFNLPTEIGIGIILLGAAPGGTSSNVMTYLGKGDVALSIAITSLTTIVAPIVMPAWVFFLVGTQIQVTFVEMFQEILFIVLLPVVAGLTIRQLLERKAPTTAKASLAAFPSISVIAIVAIVAAVVGLNADNILTVSAVALAAMIIHNTIGLASGYTIGYTAKMPEDRIRACTFEVGLQNSGLATALAITFFSPLAALLPALFSVWMLIVGPTLATYFAHQTDRKQKSQSNTEPTMTD
ncbi:bile acid:sodium symporter family protein [Haladaptatus pallidirubidus]|nr:bile acid:sodium symporter family protein [Haladaptatus pallidirubidus]